MYLPQHNLIYLTLAEGPGVARGKKNNKKNLNLFAYSTHECPAKNSAQSVQPFGRLYTTYIRMSHFII